MSRTITLLGHTQNINAAFDPKPFIRNLEAAVDQLISVRKDVQARTEQMEKSVKVSEREYSKKMADLNKGFEVCAFPRFVVGTNTFHRQSDRLSLVWKQR